MRCNGPTLDLSFARWQSLNVYITHEREPKRRDARREAEVQPPLHAPEFEHFDWWAPLLQAGVHYVHVQVPRRRGRAADNDVCVALSAALKELDATPGKARCIAERGQRCVLIPLSKMRRERERERDRDRDRETNLWLLCLWHVC